MMAATLRTTPSFTVTDRREVLRGRYDRYTLSAQYDVSPDGRRFVMIRDRGSGSESVVVVVSWFTELRERMSGGAQ